MTRSERIRAGLDADGRVAAWYCCAPDPRYGLRWVIWGDALPQRVYSTREVEAFLAL